MQFIHNSVYCHPLTLPRVSQSPADVYVDAFHNQPPAIMLFRFVLACRAVSVCVLMSHEFQLLLNSTPSSL